MSLLRSLFEKIRRTTDVASGSQAVPLMQPVGVDGADDALADLACAEARISSDAFRGLTAYHGSGDSTIREFDPRLGQGLGTWLTQNEGSAAHFALSRWYGKQASPTVYSVSISPRRVAVFKDEMSLYSFQPNGVGNYKRTAEISRLSQVMDILLAAGYDLVFLQKEQTFSVLDPNIATIQGKGAAADVIQNYPEANKAWHRQLSSLTAAQSSSGKALHHP